MFMRGRGAIKGPRRRSLYLLFLRFRHSSLDSVEARHFGFSTDYPKEEGAQFASMFIRDDYAGAAQHFAGFTYLLCYINAQDGSILIYCDATSSPPH